MTQFLSRSFFAILMLFLSACGVTEAVPKIIEVIADPGIEIGEAETQPSVINLHVYAAEEINKSIDGAPAPVVIKVYALSSDHRFLTYDFFSIVDGPEETLDVTLREVLDENQMEPDSYKILGPYELPSRTKKIGVVVEFYDIDSAVWRDTISVQEIGADDRLLVLILEEEVRLVKETL